jgi:hypothetical protein
VLNDWKVRTSLIKENPVPVKALSRHLVGFEML